MARQSKKIITNISIDVAEEAFAVYAESDAKLASITAEMDVKITAIREKYADKLTDLVDKREDAFEKLEVFAKENPDRFTKKKSLELTHGTIGFRTGTPSLKTLKGFTWASVTNLLTEFLPDFVRTKTEPDKEMLLARREENEVSDLFSKVGIEVKQEESFFVLPKKETVTA